MPKLQNRLPYRAGRFYVLREDESAATHVLCTMPPAAEAGMAGGEGIPPSKMRQVREGYHRYIPAERGVSCVLPRMLVERCMGCERTRESIRLGQAVFPAVFRAAAKSAGDCSAGGQFRELRLHQPDCC